MAENKEQIKGTIVATRPILYEGREFKTGEELPRYDADMVAAWLKYGSAKVLEKEPEKPEEPKEPEKEPEKPEEPKEPEKEPEKPEEPKEPEKEPEKPEEPKEPEKEPKSGQRGKGKK